MSRASGVAAPSQVEERARDIAASAAITRLVNIYLRESGTGRLHSAADGPLPPEVEAVARRMAQPTQAAWLHLPRTGVALVVPLVAVSAIGHHRLGGPLWRLRLDPSGRPHTPPTGGPPTAAPVESPVERAGRPHTPGASTSAGGPATAPPTAAPVVSPVELAGRPRDPGAGGPATAPPTAAPVESPVELAGLLATELLAATEPDEPGHPAEPGAIAALRREVASSLDRSARYVADRLADPDRPHVVAAPDPTQAAEGTLAFGHPFHPTPKLADGFSLDDAADYAPELAGSFPLWWIAAPPELVEQEHLPDAGPPPIPPEVAGPARAQLGPRRSDWVLVPCHPWQARALAASDDLAGALDDGTVRLTGPLGPDVRPTASVRTVRLPDGAFWKLSLDVRITNFVRHNTPEQVRRTLDASRIVTALPRRLRSGRFEVLAETAYRALALPGAPRLTTATAALHRPAPAPAPTPQGATPPIVVAGLVEPDPIDGVPPLRHLLVTAARAADVPVGHIGRRWLRAYLRISLRPLLRLLLDQGISLEAHTQNSLAGFEDGWPSRLVVRDLEGTSVDRTHPLADAHRRLLGRDDSPVLYSPDEAWHRFAYYVAVNHLGQVVATVAAETSVAEDELWAEVATLVRAEAEAATGPPADHLRRTLLGPRLPAKANLISHLLGCREEPIYVDIANPCAGS